MPGRVVHFEIHAEDPERAAQFYGSVFGWEIEKWEGPQDYWVITTGPSDEPGINGGILRRRGTVDREAMTPLVGYVCTVDVASLDDSVAAALANGGLNVMEKTPVPGVGWLVYCKDTEGNILGMMQADPTAGV